MEPGRGSLAEVLPVSLLESFTAAAATSRSVEWESRAAVRHRFRVCGAAADDISAPDAASADARQEPLAPSPESDYGDVIDGAVPRRSVAAALSLDSFEQGERPAGRPSGQLLGTLVHRLVHRFGLRAEVEDEPLMTTAAQLVKPAELPAADSHLLEEAVATFRALCGNPDVGGLYQSGEVLHEVPFTFVDDGCIVRGSIDCIVYARDRITILELKTGRPHPEHAAQVALYRRAVESIFPDCAVETRLVYAEVSRA